MGKFLFRLLASWPLPYITFGEIHAELKGSKASTYGLINRAIKEEFIKPLRRGLYLLTLPGSKKLVNQYELAQVICSPSFVTVESALQFHQAIPEAVYTICSGTKKKNCDFETPIGAFSYYKLPTKGYFYLGVERLESNESVFFMANPWRALADLIYLRKKDWKSLSDIEEDMRLDLNYYQYREQLKELVLEYPNIRTRRVLKRFI